MASQFAKLQEELRSYVTVMSRASDSIIDQEVSKYPIFVVHQIEVEIGVPLVQDLSLGPWYIHASSLEEMVAKQVVQENKVDSFRTIYKDPKKYFCLFVINELGANFVFIPR